MQNERSMERSKEADVEFEVIGWVFSSLDGKRDSRVRMLLHE